MVFGDHYPVKLSEFIPDLVNRDYNLMTKTDTIDSLREHNYAKFADDDILNFWTTVDNRDRRMKLFGGFQKACYPHYKFDTAQEQTIARICEADPAVEKWLRPALGQLRLYWDNNRREYSPDFLIGTTDGLYLLEPKMRRDMEANDVLAKARTAVEYCAPASAYTAAHGGESWDYVLIPHDRTSANASIAGLVGEFVVA